MIEALPQITEPELTDALDHLGRLIETHIRFEERKFFPQIQNEIPEELLEKIMLD